MADNLRRDKNECCLYKPRDHFSDIFVRLARLRKSNQLCDISILILDKVFRAHKVVLISASRYFEAMFLSGLAESHKDSVVLKDIEPEAFEAILDMMYDGKITITVDTVQSILCAASIFQIDHLRQACSDFMTKQLSPLNCLGIKAFAEAHGCYELMELARRHSLSRFAEVSSSEEFLVLNLDQVTDLLSRNNLRVNSEEEVFDAAVGWINYDIESRAKCMSQLLRLVRLPLLCPTVLADKVKSNSLISSSFECRDLLDEALISYHLLPERRESIPVQRTTLRRCYYDMGIIYAVGGLNSLGGTLSSVEKYDSSKGKWEASEPMKTLRSRVGVAVVNKQLYAFGGYDGSARLSTVECYNPQVEQWDLKSPMSTRRSALSIAVIGEDIYIIGGYDGNSSLCSVEVYSTSKNQWSVAPSMHTCRSAAGAAMLGNYIYVVGGHDGLSIFSTVERFDPVEKVWTMVTPMHTRRCRVGVTTARSKLFSVGGYDGQNFLNTVECYDPSANQWFVLNSMTCRRSRVGVAAIAREIYAIGGYDGLSNLSSVEIYDLDKEEWSTGQPMHMHQGGVGVAVISLD